MEKPKYFIANFSGGKDSTAMVLRLIELGEPLDEVLFCDTSMEFPAMLRHIEKVKQVVEAAGIKFTTLRAEHDFEHYLLRHRPKRKLEKYQGLSGYSWPGPQSRWCTRALKATLLDRYAAKLHEAYDLTQYVGLAADEDYRLARKRNQLEHFSHPLRAWGIWTARPGVTSCREAGPSKNWRSASPSRTSWRREATA